jgi:DNA-binding NarL/FixJ family response regulator
MLPDHRTGDSRADVSSDMTSRLFKILLIDEHKEDRESLRHSIMEADNKIRVFEAGSGETALDWFRAVQPDCVVMDLQLKDLVGTEVLTRITIEMSKKPVPIFIWTRMFSTTVSSFGIRGYFQKNKDGETALITAILDTVTHWQNEENSNPQI